jgi:outer membrane protein assembly factor BamB
VIRNSLFVWAWTVFVISSSTYGENWNAWRGPRGDGTSLETNLPQRWNGTTGEGIAWKVALPGKGHSSPIVWGDDVIVTGCDEESHERILACFDRRDGKLRWKTVVFRSDLESKHQLNSYASGTPTTDGKSIYVSFLASDGTEEPAKNVGQARMIKTGKMVVVSYDMQGNARWTRDLGHFSSAHGYCSCPILFENILIINGDHDGDSHVFGLDKETGTSLWSFPREHKTRSYCTPIIRTVAGKTQMVMSGSKQVVSLDPKTGKRFWYVEGPTEQFVASMVFDGSKFYLAAGFPDYYVMSIYPDGNGDVTQSKVAWSSTEAKCYVPSPVLVGKRLFVVDDRGTLNCFETVQGKRLWQARLGGHHSASLVTANELVYCTSDDGMVRIVRPGEALDIVSENSIGEATFASPAISQGQLFFRGETHLIAVGKPSP